MILLVYRMVICVRCSIFGSVCHSFLVKAHDSLFNTRIMIRFGSGYETTLNTRDLCFLQIVILHKEIDESYWYFAGVTWSPAEFSAAKGSLGSSGTPVACSGSRAPGRELKTGSEVGRNRWSGLWWDDGDEFGPWFRTGFRVFLHLQATWLLPCSRDGKTIIIKQPWLGMAPFILPSMVSWYHGISGWCVGDGLWHCCSLHQ